MTAAIIWKLLPQIVATIALALVSAIDYKWFDKRTRKFRTARLGLFMLLLVLMIVSVISTWRDETATAAERAALRSQLDDVKGVQFGGASYCYVEPLPPNKKSEDLDMLLTHEGQFPVYDVSVTVEDVDRLLQIMSEEEAKGRLPYASLREAFATGITPARSVISVGTVRVKQVLPVGAMRLSGRNEASYNMYIQARNGTVLEHIRLRRVAGDWKLAYRILRDGVVLRKFIDANFPLPDRKEPW